MGSSGESIEQPEISPEPLDYVLPQEEKSRAIQQGTERRIERLKTVTFTALLPFGWQTQQTPEGRSYYFNHNGTSTTWIKPINPSNDYSIPPDMLEQ